jgi:hypothetical protein
VLTCDTASGVPGGTADVTMTDISVVLSYSATAPDESLTSRRGWIWCGKEGG